MGADDERFAARHRAPGRGPRSGPQAPGLTRRGTDRVAEPQQRREPFARIQILQAIGTFEPTEGALGLGELAQDRGITPLARLRAAEAAAESHRDHREMAAIVVREIAHDERVPRHIRVQAARLLAASSEICRPEARQLLETICH